ncbi:hypothetical protein [Pleionea sediminis]|uniref:hypothetical protein n=1 Tax=Pleionea sediminis TaxID=2569479 RepID=UPI0011859CFA|nr:hypothetical protein [Pleionea sediminis]
MLLVEFSKDQRIELELDRRLSPVDNALGMVNMLCNQSIELPKAVTATAALVCHCRWAAFSRIRKGKTEAEILALYDSGSFVDCFTYDFRKTPCEKVLGQDKFCRFDDVQRSFPEDEDLFKMGISDYAGRAFRNRNYEVEGHLFVMNDWPFSNDKDLEPVISSLVSFVQVEWQHYREEQ